MLILTRRPGEKIVIGDDIVITVTEVDRGRVKLGIEAPRDVPVFRQELVPADRMPRPGCPVCRNPRCADPGGKH